MFECKYCGKSFVRETTLASHMCEKKRRMLGEHERPNQIALQIWLKFYKFTTPNAKKAKTYEDFIASQYYTAFVKFARHVIDLNPHDMEGFVDFVFRFGVRLDDWHKAYVYEAWIRENNKKETVDRAAERNILLMQSWAESTGEDWRKFFDLVNTNQAVHWIKTGRISPWVLYATRGGERLVDRLNHEQIDIVAEYIEPKYWQFKVAKQKDDAKWIEKMFSDAGI
jgi:hypothetical protein